MNIKAVSKKVLSDLLHVIKELKEEDYSRSIDVLSGFTLGQHIRHTLEFYLCLHQGSILGVVNYDKRKRDLQIETQPVYAATTIDSICQFIDSADVDQSILLEVNYNLDSEKSQVIKSNLNRELCYNIEHAIHHMAIIKIGLNEIAPYVELSEGFGIAVSTLRHLKSNAQEA